MLSKGQVPGGPEESKLKIFCLSWESRLLYTEKRTRGAESLTVVVDWSIKERVRAKSIHSVIQGN